MTSLAVSAKVIFMETTLKILLALADAYNDTGDYVFNPLKIALQAMDVAELQAHLAYVTAKGETMKDCQELRDLFNLAQDILGAIAKKTF